MLLKNLISFVFILLFATFSGFSQNKKLLFLQLTNENGLSNNSVTCVLKDSRGFIWIGTVDGLNCYDGYKFTVYKHDPNDSCTISDNYIGAIVEDFSGNLWIGTQGGGLNMYSSERDKFIRYYHDPKNANSLPSNYIFHHNSMFIDKDTVLWLGTDKGLGGFYINQKKFVNYQLNFPGFGKNDFKDIRAISGDNNNILWIGTNNGLIEFDKNVGIKKIFRHESLNNTGLSNNIITSILFNNYNNEIWVGTEDGLNTLSLANGSFKHYYSDKNNSQTINDNSITTLERSNDGNIWIGTKSGGLNEYNKTENCFYHWTNSPLNPYSLSDNYVDNIFYDNKGFLWVGTVNDGINLLNLNSSQFSLLRKDPSSDNSLSNNIIRSILKDSKGILWIGTYGGGLNRYDGKRYIHYIHQPDNPSSLSHNIVSSIFEDHSGVLWIGTWGGGVNILEGKSGRFTRTIIGLPDYINDIVEDKNRNIWFGGNGGLYIYSYKTKTVYRLDSDIDIRKRLTASSISKILFDHNADVWVATFDGINKIILKKAENPEIDTVVRFTKEDLFKLNITDPRIMTLYEDKAQNIWVGTYTGGLSMLKFGPDLRCNFKTYSEKDGLAGNIIYGILEDEQRNLWVSTNNGLSRFNLKKGNFLNFNSDNGLQSNQFYWNACYKDKSGEMFFGGLKGLNHFFPDSVIDTKTFPKVYITGLYLFNKPVTAGKKEFDREILKKSIFYTKEITLERNEYPFSFDFAALLYKSQNKIKYAYKLENFDADWLYTDALKRYAIYSHLRPGKYIFKVKSTNEYGIWNNEYTSIKVTILPAIWETIWAYILYVLTIIILLYLFRRQTLIRAKLRHEIQFQKLEKEKTQEYNELKLRFFTNISHEFRTPLTLITGPLDNLLSSSNIQQNIKEQLQLIHSGSKRLLKLINRLLEFRKVETGNIELKVSRRDIIPLLEEFSLLFKSKAIDNNINYQRNFPGNTLSIWFDEYIVETIVYNLLSNAFKFTPKGGEITLHLELLNEHEEPIIKEKLMAGQEVYYINISVKDNGPGIPEDKKDLIFKPFYQINQTTQNAKNGSGIGLALCKELANAHYGNIYLENVRNGGAVLVVKIPVHETFFAEKEKNAETIERRKIENQLYDEITIEDIVLPNFKGPETAKAPMILIIEDDIELVSYIGKILEGTYKIKYALNGSDGLQMALDDEPDLIVSDIMMPGLSGFEVCERLKSDLRLSHIPIILLTALTSIDDRIMGISIGADDYISKPFNQQHLLVRIEKLIEQRKNLRKHFQKDIATLSDKNLTSIDEQLLKKVIDCIEKNIDDSELSVDTLGSEVGISSTHLNRKMKSLTGMTTNEFIRKIRLKKAASLLLAKQGNISQIMYSVGFNNSSYFAKCFQEEFGVTPKEYMSQN